MKQLALICSLFSIVACSAASEDPSASTSQAVTATDWTSIETSALVGGPPQHLCLFANGPNASGTPVILATCSNTNAGTSFALVPSNAGVPMGTYTPHVRIELKNQNGTLSGFCLAPGAGNASSALAFCTSASTALYYQYGAIFTPGLLCLQSLENGSGQLPWGSCSTANTGWIPVEQPCFAYARTSPGTLYAASASGEVEELTPSSTVVDGVAQPTAAEQFCNAVNLSGLTQHGDVSFTAGPCTAFTSGVQEQGGPAFPLFMASAGFTNFNYNRANIPGVGWDGQLSDNNGRCWEETSAAGNEVLMESCVGAGAESTWEMICAGH